jgi:hypothetical protein
VTRQGRGAPCVSGRYSTGNGQSRQHLGPPRHRLDRSGTWPANTWSGPSGRAFGITESARPVTTRESLRQLRDASCRRRWPGAGYGCCCHGWPHAAKRAAVCSSARNCIDASSSSSSSLPSTFWEGVCERAAGGLRPDPRTFGRPDLVIGSCNSGRVTRGSGKPQIA